MINRRKLSISVIPDKKDDDVVAGRIL